MRASSILLVALWLAACGGGGGADDVSDTSGAPTSGTPTSGPSSDACAPGWEGCPCHEGVCIAGLECLSGFCVAVPGGETTEAPDPSTTDAPTTLDASGDTDPASTSSGDDAPVESSSSEESTDDGPPPECFEGDTWCDEDPDAFDDDVLLTCVEGQWHESTCADACAVDGYDVSSPGCESPPDRCRCGGYLDAECVSGALTACYCRQYILGVPCEDAAAEYTPCFHGEIDLSCWAQYEPYTIEECTNAVEACE